jgi:hypothetical protein
MMYEYGGEPDRLVGYADHELRFWMQTSTGLTKAALNEVILLRATISRLVTESKSSPQ